MKPNDPHDWQITLMGHASSECVRKHFRGTIDDALHEADVMECDPDWDVLGVHIIRTDLPNSDSQTQGLISKS